MGSKAPKSETVVKGGKPVVVREWMSPQYLKELSNLSEYYGNRALQERSTYNEAVNRALSSYGRAPLYDPMKTETGGTIAPGQVSTPYDVTKLVEAAQESGMFKPPAQQQQSQKNKEDAQSAYSKAIKNKKSKVAPMPRMTGGG